MFGTSLAWQFDCRLYHTKAPNDSADARACVQFRYAPQWYADACRKNHSGQFHPGSQSEQAPPGGGPALDEDTLQQLPEEHRVRFRIG